MIDFTTYLAGYFAMDFTVGFTADDSTKVNAAIPWKFLLLHLLIVLTICFPNDCFFNQGIVVSLGLAEF